MARVDGALIIGTVLPNSTLMPYYYNMNDHERHPFKTKAPAPSGAEPKAAAGRCNRSSAGEVGERLRVPDVAQMGDGTGGRVARVVPALERGHEDRPPELWAMVPAKCAHASTLSTPLVRGRGGRGPAPGRVGTARLQRMVTG